METARLAEDSLRSEVGMGGESRRRSEMREVRSGDSRKVNNFGEFREIKPTLNF